MVRWWNVHDVSPSGLRFNRAWYIRQFLFALIPPACVLVLFEAVSRSETRRKLGNLSIKDGIEKNSTGDHKSDIDMKVTQAWSFIPGEVEVVLQGVRESVREKWAAVAVSPEADKSVLGKIRGWVDSATYTGGGPVLDAIRQALGRRNPPERSVAEIDVSDKGGKEKEAPNEINTPPDSLNEKGPKKSAMRQRREDGRRGTH